MEQEISTNIENVPFVKRIAFSCSKRGCNHCVWIHMCIQHGQEDAMDEEVKSE